jgi:hypothetical protein
MNPVIGTISGILPKGALARQALDRLQAEVVVTNDAIKFLGLSLLPLEETRALLLEHLKRAMYTNTPENAFLLFQIRGGDLALPSVLGIAELAWIETPEVLVDKIMQRIKANGRDVGLPAAKHGAELGRLRAKLDQLEYDEEAEVLRLEVAGHSILRRETARPEILFKVWGKQAERAAA